MRNELHEAGYDTGHGFNPVPSMFTLCNAMCGFSAILLVVSYRPADMVVPTLALWLIFCAMIFDVLDGVAARALNACSLHGMNLDSLADAISFGAAPAVFIHSVGMEAVQMHSLPAVVVRLLSGIYLGCALWRLAVYNSRSILGIDKESKVMFTGLPSPAAAAMICCMVVLYSQLPLMKHYYFLVFVVYSLVASFLMVSSVPYPHIRNIIVRLPVWLSLLFGSSAVLLIWLHGFLGVVMLAHIYILLPPVNEFVGRLIRRAEIRDESGL